MPTLEWAQAATRILDLPHAEILGFMRDIAEHTPTLQIADDGEPPQQVDARVIDDDVGRRVHLAQEPSVVSLEDRVGPESGPGDFWPHALAQRHALLERILVGLIDLGAIAAGPTRAPRRVWTHEVATETSLHPASIRRALSRKRGTWNGEPFWLSDLLIDAQGVATLATRDLGESVHLDGVRLVVPARALDHDQQVLLSLPHADALPPLLGRIGPIVAVGPAQTTLLAPAYLVFPVETHASAHFLENGEWHEWDAATRAGSHPCATIRIHRFGVWGVAASGKA